MPAPAIAHINRIGTALPPNDVHEAFVDFVGGLIKDRRDQLIFKRLVGRSAIDHRTEAAEVEEPPLDSARDLVRRHWHEDVRSGAGHSKHPKSALQEWAAGNRKRMPEYRLVERSGPDHAAHQPRTVAPPGPQRSRH